jgi:hypothetical protein
MENQPFSLQAPEAIAKKYGGNKQKIAMAAQNGLLDPTAAVMAGMFIDRMRSAQTAEQGPQPTVAQQVLTPQPAPAAPAGLGAMAPGGMPPMAPPMGGGAPPPMPMPQGGLPMAAAEGGLMSSGGLSTLPVPNDMFDEPHGVSMADGGIVAFREAGPVGDYEDAPTYEEMMAEFDPLNPKGMARAFGPHTPRVLSHKEVMQRFGTAQAKKHPSNILPTVEMPSGVGKFFDHLINGGTPEEKAAAAQRARDYLQQNSKSAIADVGLSASPSSTPAASQRAVSLSPTAKPTINPAVAAALANQGTIPTAKPTINPAVAAALATRSTTTPAPIPAAAPAKGLAALVPAAKAPAAKAPADTGKSKTRTAAIKTLTSNLAPAAAQSATNEFGVPTSLQGGVDFVKKAMEPLSTDALKAMQKDIADTPDRLKKQKQEDLWSSLAQIGFGMAATKSPSFLQAFGESAGAALPGMQAALKERRAAERDATKQALELENLQYGRAADIIKSGTELGMKGIELREAKFDRQQQHQIQLAQLELQRSEGILNRDAANANARLAQNTAADRLLEIYFQGLKKANPKLDDATLRMKAAEAIKEPVAAAVPDILTGLGPKTGKDKTATLSWNPNL